MVEEKLLLGFQPKQTTRQLYFPRSISFVECFECDQILLMSMSYRQPWAKCSRFQEGKRGYCWKLQGNNSSVGQLDKCCWAHFLKTQAFGTISDYHSIIVSKSSFFFPFALIALCFSPLWLTYLITFGSQLQYFTSILIVYEARTTQWRSRTDVGHQHVSDNHIRSVLIIPILFTLERHTPTL